MKEMNQVFMLLILYSVSWLANLRTSLFVGANLLKQLPKPTVEVMLNNNRFITEFSSFTSDHPNDSSSTNTAEYQQFAKNLDNKLAHFCNFLADFSESRNWEAVRILFPTPAVNVYVCGYIQRFLTRKHVHVICETYDHDKSLLRGNETTLGRPSAQQRLSLSDFYANASKPMVKYFETLPIVTLNFLHSKSGHEISSTLARQFSPVTPVLMLGHNFNLPNLRPRLNFNYKLTLASYGGTGDDPAYAGSSNTEVKINVEDIYGFATSSESVRNPLGFWSSSDGLHLVKETRLENFHGQVLRVTSVEGNPVVYLDRDSSDQVVQARGYLPDILETISFNLNFTYALIEPKDRGFGSVDSSGNWTGMVGQIKRQEVDIALMSFSLTASRKEVMDFSPPIEYSATRLLIRRDVQNTELKWNVFLEPFHWEIWLAIPCTVALGVLLISVFTYFEIMDTTPIASACNLFVCFLQKSLEGHFKFERLPSRIVLGTFWMLAVVIYASYTAVLTSFLASTTEKLPINSLSEAVYNSHWKIGLVKGSSYQDRVKDSPEPEFQEFTKRIDRDQSSLVGGFREGVSKVYNEKYAFFTSDLVPAFMIKDNCSFTWVPGKYYPGFGYMGYQKHLPYATSISHRVAKIRETGQMRRLFKKWWGESSGCSGIGGGFKGMSLYETGTAFLLLILGASIAFSLLIIELVLHPKRDKHNSTSRLSIIEDQSFRHGQEYDGIRDSHTPQMFTYNSDFGRMFRNDESRLPDLRRGFWRPFHTTSVVK